MMAIGTLYYSHSTTRANAQFKSIPFHSASIDWKREEASTMSFKSPVKLSEADRIRYKSDTTDFGGQVYKIQKSVGDDYQYEVISYLRLYHDKVTCSFSNLTSSQIMKKVLQLSKNDFVTSGVKDTKIIHSNVKWENTSIWDIALQLCWLEAQAGYNVQAKVDANGTLLFNYADTQEKGYNFTEVYDYDEELDSSDLITRATIVNGNQEVANATASSSIVAKWGYVSEVEDCSSSSTKNSTTATTTKTDSSLKNTAMINKYNIPSKVVNQALAVAKQGNSQYDNMKLLYNWCNQHIGYEGYSNTKYGAGGTLSHRKGNCCDNANLLIAMARSIGITCRYAHAKQGSQGHVYGEYYINGKWITIDTGTRSTTQYWNGHWSGFGGTDARYERLPF